MNKLPLLNIANIGSTIYLFCRDENGKPFIKKEEMFKPYFYEPKEGGIYRAYDGTSLEKIVCKKPSEVKMQRSNDSWESDVIYIKRYLIDNIEIVKAPIRWMFLDIEVQTDIFPDVEKAEKPISCVSIYDNFDNKGITFWLPNYKSEWEMSDRVANYIKERQPDLLIAFNGVNFDFPYMFTRWPDVSEKISPINKVEYHNKFPMGISCVDYYGWDKKMTLNRRKQYTLDAVAEEEVNMKSSGKVNFASLDENIREKNIYDIKRMIAIEKKKQYIPLFNDIRLLSKCLWADMELNSRIIDQLLLQEAKNVGVVLPKKVYEEERQDSEDDEFEGAYRECFKVGLLKNLSVYDLSGAYLNMIKDLCLDGSNISQKEGLKINVTDRKTNKIKQTYKIIQNNKAILPILVDKLINDKIKYKKEKDNKIPNTEEAKIAESKYNAMKSVYLSCFDDTTSVLTLKGIKSIKNLAVGDKVYSVNPVTLKIEIDEIIQVQKYYYDGPFYEYKTDLAKLRMTPDHKFLVQNYGKFAVNYKSVEECYNSINRHQNSIPKIYPQEARTNNRITLLAEVQDLNGCIYIVPKKEFIYKYRNIIPKGFKRIDNSIKINKKLLHGFRYISANNITEKELLKLQDKGWQLFGSGTKHKKWSPVIFDSQQFAAFLGWFISEGTIYNTKISICQNKLVHNSYYNEILALLTELNIGHVYKSKKELSITSEILVKYLQKGAGKGVYNKKIPKWILNSNIEIKKAFFESLYKGDGNKNACRYSTVSYQLVQDLLQLLVSMGNNSVRYYKEYKKDSYGKEIYRIIWHNAIKGVAKEYLTKTLFNGMVYCCTTKNNHNLFAGSDGFFTLIGQCWGVIGNRGFRLFDPRIAGLITSNVRDLIHYVKNELLKIKKEIIYIDTDSCIVADDGQDNSKFMNELIQKWSQDRFNKPSSIQFEYQGTFEKLFLIALCHYSGLLKTNKGLKVEEKGIEAKKKDSTIFMSKTQREAINMVLNGCTEQDLLAYKAKQIEDIKTVPFIEISLPNKIAPNKEYKNEPIHARAFRYAQENGNLLNIRPGDLFYWIYTEPFGIESKVSPRKVKVTKKELKEGTKPEWTKNSKGEYFKIVNKETKKDKNVIAFTEEEPLDLNRYKIDMPKMIERNITKKLDKIIEAFKGGIVTEKEEGEE